MRTCGGHRWRELPSGMRWCERCNRTLEQALLDIAGLPVGLPFGWSPRLRGERKVDVQ